MGKKGNFLLRAIEEGIEMLKGWQEALLKEKKSSMELEGLILHLIEAETTAEVVYLAEEQRKYIQFHQKRS